MNCLQTMEYINNLINFYKLVIADNLNYKAHVIQETLKDIQYKDIIVYPNAVHFEPCQRPQHILREFANRGYLCLFCDYCPGEDWIIKKVGYNFYVINCEEHLLSFVQDKKVIIYMTFFIQGIFADLCPNKIIWMDIVDRLDFFGSYNPLSREIWDKYISTANILSYTADNLQEYLLKRKDAISLPNAVNMDDFITNCYDHEIVLEKKNKPIVGYFGAVEEWFNCDIVQYIANTDRYEIVIIGRIGIDPKKLKHKNIILLGAVPYLQLQQHTKGFDVAIIPFKVNDLTNSVSPVKLFEYCSLGLPIVSTPIKEVAKYNSRNIKLANTSLKFLKEIDMFVNASQDEKFKIKSAALEIAKNNEWVHRVDVIEEKIKGLR